MSSIWKSIGSFVVFALIGCGESLMIASDDAMGSAAGDEGFARDTVDVEQAAPSEWTNCLRVSDGRLAQIGGGRRFEPGVDIQLEVRFTNLCDTDIVAYPGLRFSSSSEYVRFRERSLFLYGILGNQSLVMATQLTLDPGPTAGESIEFDVAVTNLGCEEDASDQRGAQICEDLSEGYSFTWQVGEALMAPEL